MQRIGAAVILVMAALAIMVVVLAREVVVDFRKLGANTASFAVFVIYIAWLPLALAAGLAGIMVITWDARGRAPSRPSST